MPPPLVPLLASFVPALWLGVVLAISFLETPLKFRAPGVPRTAALSIGRVVFRALGRVELGLWLIEALALWGAGWPGRSASWFAALSAIVLLQQAWWAPVLQRRAADAIAGSPTPSGRRVHQLYIVSEGTKIVLLPALYLSLAQTLAI